MSAQPHEYHHEPDYSSAEDSLVVRFEGVFTRDDVRAAIDSARAEIEPGSRIRDFLELLVERLATDILRARERSGVEEPAPL